MEVRGNQRLWTIDAAALQMMNRAARTNAHNTSMRSQSDGHSNNRACVLLCTNAAINEIPSKLPVPLPN